MKKPTNPFTSKPVQYSNETPDWHRPANVPLIWYKLKYNLISGSISTTITEWYGNEKERDARYVNLCSTHFIDLSICIYSRALDNTYRVQYKATNGNWMIASFMWQSEFKLFVNYFKMQVICKLF